MGAFTCASSVGERPASWPGRARRCRCRCWLRWPSKLRQTLHADLAADARLIVVDAFAAGRVARGEAWRFNHLESAVSIRDGAGWLFHDRFVLRGGGGYDGLGFTESQPYFATVVVIA